MRVFCAVFFVFFSFPKSFISIVISKIDYLDHIPYFSTPFHGNERRALFQKAVPIKKI